MIFVAVDKGGYVQSGIASNMMVIGYIVLFILYFPALLKAIKIMRQIK